MGLDAALSDSEKHGISHSELFIEIKILLPYDDLSPWPL